MVLLENGCWRENKKKRPRAESWTAGKRWDRLKTVKQKLETLHGENEVQYATKDDSGSAVSLHESSVVGHGKFV